MPTLSSRCNPLESFSERCYAAVAPRRRSRVPSARRRLASLDTPPLSSVTHNRAAKRLRRFRPKSGSGSGLSRTMVRSSFAASGPSSMPGPSSGGWSLPNPPRVRRLNTAGHAGRRGPVPAGPLCGPAAPGYASALHWRPAVPDDATHAGLAAPAVAGVADMEAAKRNRRSRLAAGLAPSTLPGSLPLHALPTPVHTLPVEAPNPADPRYYPLCP